MKRDDAVSLAERLVQERQLREVMVIVRPEDPDHWEVLVDLHDGGGNRMEPEEAIEEERTVLEGRLGYEVTMTDRYLTVK